MRAELGRWEEVSADLLGKYSTQLAVNVPLQDTEKLFKSCLRVDSEWRTVSKLMEKWLLHEPSKTILDRNFNYEMALISLTSKDFDRARFYADRETSELLRSWLNLTKLS